MDKKSKVLILGTLIVVALTLIAGITYAYWSTTKIQESTNVVASSCLDLTIVNEENAINIEDAVPISDEEAETLTPFKITVKNTCDSTIEYQANLEVLGTTTLDSEYLAIKVDDKERALLSTLDSVNATIDGAKEGRKLTTGLLGPNEWYTHSIRIWMDKDVEYIETTINKLFESKVVIEGKAVAEDKDTYKIDGTITADNAEKTPLVNTDIVVKDYEEKEYNTTTDGNGNFTLEVPRGGYDVYYRDTKIGSVGTNGSSTSVGNGYSISSITDVNPSSTTTVLRETWDSDTSAFRSDTYRENTKNITIENKINIPETVTAEEKWDISKAQDGSIMSYVVPNETEGYYDLYIQSNKQILGNEDMSYWFYNFRNVETINGLNLIDTSKVKNMHSMFSYAGYSSQNLAIDLSSFDTSSVENMSEMFYYTGRSSTNFTLDVSNFDTSNVYDMGYMFYYTGYSSQNLTLDVSKFDTSNVTDMRRMFEYTGYSNPNFTLDVSNFNTSNVVYMSHMFSSTGYSSTDFTLDVSNFDTGNVIAMKSMFQNTGYNSKNFTLDVSNFNTSNVTDMSWMFWNTGYRSQKFTLDVSNFDTSKVTNMQRMFENAGYSNSNFTLDVGTFDTSNVRDARTMFKNTGYNSTKLNITITIRNPSLTSYSSMFNGVATKPGSQIIVNYTAATSSIVDKMIATKAANGNVVKGAQVE